MLKDIRIPSTFIIATYNNSGNFTQPMDSSSLTILSHPNKYKELFKSYGLTYKLDVVNSLEEMIRILGM